MSKLPSIHEDSTISFGVKSGISEFKTTSPTLNDEETKHSFKLRETLLQNPKLDRKELHLSYEKPYSNRESWWRVTVKETPLPQTYQGNDSEFIQEINKRTNTYRFKTDGRRLDPTPQIGHGEYLLPGAYETEDLADRVERLNISYGFKGPLREFYLKRNMFINHDKDINVSPNAYETEKYGTISAKPEPSKLSSFKSKTKRKVFPPKEGPSPGLYEQPNIYMKPKISSSFKSKTIRFKPKKNFTPGPGAYWPLTTLPVVTRHLDELGTKGVFFTPNFNIAAAI